VPSFFKFFFLEATLEADFKACHRIIELDIFPRYFDSLFVEIIIKHKKQSRLFISKFFNYKHPRKT
jgi:hypothetical protein